ncbi:MAG: integrase, partial [Chroococcidiopsidaceae cyanobacterium CP_BM_RX_35]|nr:integrase [Chroococcidiopsidaceae cyanobacterium CP_BM_RX_35]
NLQPLCPAEIEQLQQLEQLRVTDWLLESERQQRLSARSLHHIVQQAGEIAGLPFPVHPYMLRRSGLFYRAALLLATAQLSLRECCLLWNYHATSIPLTASTQKDYYTIGRKREEVFLHALERLKAFTGIAALENVIDYLLGAYLLFPQLTELPHNYWLAPSRWSC